jgi:hypothetical protein
MEDGKVGRGDGVLLKRKNRLLPHRKLAEEAGIEYGFGRGL